MKTLHKIISGGQTGVDQAALRAARDCGLEIGGWCPPGRVCEGGKIPEEFPLRETPNERSRGAPDVARSLRTEWNVRDSDGVLIIGAVREDPGTAWAVKCAARYEKPLLVCAVDDPKAADRIREWLAQRRVETLSVGGPSERTSPGIGDKAYALMRQVLS